jgi:hypothetical protein
MVLIDVVVMYPGHKCRLCFDEGLRWEEYVKILESGLTDEDKVIEMVIAYPRISGREVQFLLNDPRKHKVSQYKALLYLRRAKFRLANERLMEKKRIMPHSLCPTMESKETF